MGTSSVRAMLRNLIIVIKTSSLLTLGPIMTFGRLFSGQMGGLYYCPFSIPFVLCQVCPAPCSFKLIQPWLFSGIIASSLLMGRVFCGLFCPLGIVSSLLYRSQGKKINFSGAGSKLTYVKFVTMMLFLYLIAEAAGILLGVWPYEGVWALLVAYRELTVIVIIAVVLVFLTFSIFFHRPWCSHLCPFGTLLSLFNQFSILSLRPNLEECGECDACIQNCPLDLSNPSDSTDCIRCLSCFTACRRGAMRLQIRGFGMHQPSHDFE